MYLIRAGVCQDLPTKVPLVGGASATTVTAATSAIFVRLVVVAAASAVDVSATMLVRRLYVASS